MPLSNHLTRTFAVLVVASAAVLGAPTAHAQWKVKDTDANKVLGEVKNGSTINSNLYDIKTIGAGNKDKNWIGERVKDPVPNLPKSDSDAAKLNDGTVCKTVAKTQQATCQSIVDIENAQYKFMVTMYETSKTRDDKLRELLEERGKLDTKDFGKLEDNTNKLTALYALIQLDRQQMESVNFAYEANLKYLRAQQTQAANIATKGGSAGKYGNFDLPLVGSVDVGNMLNGIIAGAVLKETLSKLQTDKPEGMRRLQVTQGF